MTRRTRFVPNSTHGGSCCSKRLTEEHTTMKPKNTICLWFDKEAHEAARFYAATFPESAVTAVHKAPSDYPSGKRGDVLTVEFTVLDRTGRDRVYLTPHGLYSAPV